MNKITRSLLSGASLAVLALGLPQSVSAGTTIGSTSGDVSVTGTTNFVSVTGTVSGNVTITADALITPGTCNSATCFGVAVTSGASITGSLINNGTVLVQVTGMTSNDVAAGILISGDVGAVVNNGNITVSASGTGGQLFGVVLYGGSAGSFENDGSIIVKGTINCTGAEGSCFAGSGGEGGPFGFYVDPFAENGATDCVQGGEGQFCVGGEGEQQPQPLNGVQAKVVNGLGGGNDPVGFARFNSAPDQFTVNNPVFGVIQAQNTMIGNGTLTDVGVILSAVGGAGGNVTYVVNNSGFIGGTAAVIAPTFASAIGAGVLIVASAAGGTSAVASVNNLGGTISANAYAWAGSSANAFAVGIFEVAVAATNFASAAVSNTNLINVSATAWASTGWAFATAIGLEQIASASGTAVASFVNGGNLSVSASASAWFNTTVLAGAVAVGVFQSVGAGGVASALIANSGNINVFASADASSALAAIASASVIGIAQIAAGGTALASLVNSGGINITASAEASGASFAAANAAVVGILQLASGAKAAAVLSNQVTGVINVSANASASSAFIASASALANGIVQFAFGKTAVASLGNAGKITVSANATASFASSATAHAGAIGIDQSAFGGSSASAVLVNSGGINVEAGAWASSAAFASAGASAIGIVQNVIAKTTANASLVNSNGIDVGASAWATGSDAFATANVVLGVGQFAVGKTAAVNLSNAAGGVMDFHAAAFAGATFVGSATANANVLAGIVQIAFGAAASANIVNNGSLLASANATAIATFSSSAHANVFVHLATQLAVGSVASVNFTNNAVVSAFGTAVALTSGVGFSSGGAVTTVAGFGSAYAVADADALINQFAIGGPTASANYANNGAVLVSANAFAVAGFIAKASATASYLAQSASATGTAAAKFVNGGIVTASGFVPAVLSVVANATALAFTAFASAFASASGVSQAVDANAGTLAVASVTNLGTINVSANALAVIVLGGAAAGAQAFGVFQSASSASAAVAGLINATSAAINVTANATAIGGAVAGANASATDIIQAVHFASFAGAFLTNDGLVHASANAAASAATLATAHAFAGGIGQFASFAGAASVGLVNSASGVINVTANASAFAGGTAVALATAVGVSQAAIVATFAGAGLSNQGVVHVSASALATASGFALAKATAVGILEVAGIAVVASASLVNGSSLAATPALISVHANASVPASFVSVGTASAFAAGVFQLASGSVLAGAFLSNQGVIDVGANAFVSAFTFATASATALGVSQIAGGAAGTTIGGVPFGDTAVLLNYGTISVTAHAKATFGTFNFAFASAFGVHQQALGTPAALFAGAFMTNTGLIEVDAFATVIAGPLFGISGTASAHAIGVVQSAGTAFTAVAQMVNSGTIGPLAVAYAQVWGLAAANAVATGQKQLAFEGGALGSKANANYLNSGNVLATAIATAKAGISAFATAAALGISQNAINASSATATLLNTGFINASAHADAHGAIAIASAAATGVIQFASATNGLGAPIASLALAAFTNSGTVNAVASASAHGGLDIPVANALGVSQSAWAPSGATTAANVLLNATLGLINVSAHAVASFGNAAGFGAGSTEFAGAIGVTQSASHTFTPGIFALNAVTNLGTIHVSASAVGVGGEWANVGASALGIGQFAWNAVLASDVVVNGGNLTVLANASAQTTQDGFGANAVAAATGVHQLALATTFGTAAAVVINSGTMIVHAHAKAVGFTSGVAPGFFTSALAVASATGVHQSLGGATLNVAFATVINSASFDVQATATANGRVTVTALGSTFALATAAAFAVGVSATAFTPLFDVLNIVNSGSFHVEANARGNGFALASATGMWATGFLMFGTMANHAKMSVTAQATGVPGHTALGSATTAANFASALGMGVAASSFTGVISNTGSLHVAAITGNGSGNVFATGILVVGGGFGVGPGTVFNSGDLWAGVSMDGGTTFYRGTAINTFFAPNPMNVILSGGGQTANSEGAHIYGNIIISADDVISVVNGRVCFNGVVNQPYTSGTTAGIVTNTAKAYPLTAPFLPSLETAGLGGIDPFVSGVAVGQLTVASTGILVLENDPQQGAAGAYVSTYTQAAGGQLVMQIRGVTPNGGLGGDNTVGKIVANVSANLAGSLEIIPFAGLYTDTSYAILSARAVASGGGGIVGNWAVSDPSVLLDFIVTNNGEIGVDQKILNVNRIAFDDPSLGLTPNAAQVGHGIELTYSTALTGDYADMVAKLFQIGSNPEYQDAMRQLSGVEYGFLVNASHTSVRMLNNTVGTHLQVIANGGSDHVGQLIKGVSPAAGGTGIGKGNVWISAWGNWGDPDAKGSNPETRTSERGMLVGVDFDMDNQTRLGVVGGESSGRVRFKDDYHNSAEYRGWHLGLYGRYDDDSAPWYVEGVGAYSVYTNDVTRNIFIDPTINTLCCTFGFTEPSSVIAGRAHGAFDSHTYSFAAEAGWNMDTGSAIDLTPFLGFSWMDTNTDSFDETGFAGGNLHIGDATAESFASHLGVRLTTDWAITEHMLISPVIRLEWEHEFEDDLWSVQESFAGAPVGGTFRTTGTGYADDFLNIGAAAAFDISGRVDAVIGYEGHFSSDEHHNAITGRVNLHW